MCCSTFYPDSADDARPSGRVSVHMDDYPFLIKLVTFSMSRNFETNHSRVICLAAKGGDIWRSSHLSSQDLGL